MPEESCLPDTEDSEYSYIKDLIEEGDALEAQALTVARACIDWQKLSRQDAFPPAGLRQLAESLRLAAPNLQDKQKEVSFLRKRHVLDVLVGASLASACAWSCCKHWWRTWH